MQKNATRTSSNSAKLTKKTTKKMGTPSPPKKRKPDREKNEAETAKTPKKKGPGKILTVVAKKGNVGRKDLKTTPKKTPTTVKATRKSVAIKGVTKAPVKRVTKPRTTVTKKTLEEDDVTSPKAKKLKKSEEVLNDQTIKTTAKKPNSKLKTSEQAVKSSLPTDVTPKKIPVQKMNPRTPKSTTPKPRRRPAKPKVAKKSVSKDSTKAALGPKPELLDSEPIKSESSIIEIDKVEHSKLEPSTPEPSKTDLFKLDPSKLEPIKFECTKLEPSKSESSKSEPSKSESAKSELTKPESTKPESTKPESMNLDTTKIENIQKSKEFIETDKNVNKKIVESEKKMKRIEEDLDSKETIAKLLKQASKTMLKGTKKRREILDLKKNHKVLAKKAKLTKPKKIQNIVKTESNKFIEAKLIKKYIKKKVVNVEDKLQWNEEPPKIEVPLKAEPEKTEFKTVDEEKNTNTDDSTTSDELTLNQIRQNSTPVPKSESCSSKSEAKSVKVSKLKRKIKLEQVSDNEKKVKPIKKGTAKSLLQKKKLLLLKKKAAKIKDKKRSVSTDTEQRGRKLKLYSWWTGPKRHRVASLNALAKVHCLYENETRGAIYDAMKQSPAAKESNSDPEHTPTVEPTVEVSSRILRTVPGGRGIGKHWENNETSSSSSCEDNSNDSSTEETKVTSKLLTPPPSYKQKQQKEIAEVKLEEMKEVKEKKKPVRKKRNRTELVMDLKDMVVRKRMASLNASAMLAASYSVEKKPIPSSRSSTSDEEDDSDASVMADDNFKRKCFEEDVKKEEDRKLLEVRASPNKKVAVILNQDTDVTITGVYVNSTTRSTHHEGYCSIAGMQYRISATSHTQTAATAVATETLLHTATDHSTGEQPLTVPCKSYTPLGALSSMQPPGSGVGSAPPPMSPSGRRHGCSSAFTAPPAYGPPPPPPPGHHHHPGPPVPPPPPSHHPPPLPGADQQPPPPTYIHGYYQPAGPLITAHHGHSHPPPVPVGKAVPLPTLEASPSPTPPPTTHQPPPSSTGTAESSDNEVIITSASSGTEPAAVQLPPPAQQYRYTTQYAPAGAHGPPGYSYSYPPSQYYHSAPSGFAQQQHYHHDICYPGSSYPASYLHPKAYATTYRRYLPPSAGPQYYPGQPELYSAPPSNAQNSQVVTASSGGGSGGSGYQPPPSGPPPPTLVESYAPPPPPVPPTIVEPYPPPHYYTSYGTGPAPPACYTHSPPTRNLTYIDAAYQSCPCPMQSCPKNVHTGPLTGDGKRSNGTAIAKESMPLPPVALALPLEPASVAGPPSPARGSAGMPPPPSPAGATYQPCPTTIPKWDAKQETTETVLECKVMTEKRGKARVGKTMVRNSITSNMNTTGMLLMCHNPPNQQQITAEVVNNVKREVESPEEIVIPAESQQKHDRIDMEKATNQILDIEKTEVQMSNECSKRLAPEINQKCLKNEDCSDTEVKNKDLEDPKQKFESIEEAEIKPERITVKRKLSIEDPAETADDYKVEVKIPKTSPKIKPANGSYKDLFKKNNKCSNVKQKVVEAKVIERKFLLCKTPKIMLGRSKKTKRKQTTTKDEPASKRAKTSKPLVASNLHNSKQNTTKSKGNINKVIVDLTENKQLAQKKNSGKKVNSKSNNLINNVDRIIESVILNSIVEDVRTSVDSVLPNSDNVNVDFLTENNNSAVKTNLQIATRVAANNIHNNNNNNNKLYKLGSSRSGKRKAKANSCTTPLVLPVARIPRKSIHLPRWSNGWAWEGEPFQGKVFLTSDEALVTRRCYPAMRHSEGDIISPRDCVLLKAGQRKIDLPFVAKVAALWEDEDGEMMMSLLWFYRPEHTEQGRKPADQPDEVFASRHKDTNSVACIEDKCYVLTFNEYCRYRKLAKRLEEGMDLPGPVVPLPEGGVYQRQHRQPPLPVVTAPDLVFFCRQVYDFRQKRLARNPS